MDDIYMNYIQEKIITIFSQCRPRRTNPHSSSASSSLYGISQGPNLSLISRASGFDRGR